MNHNTAIPYPITNCFICGDECKDWESGNQNACLACAIKMHQIEDPGCNKPRDKSDPKVGDGFPIHPRWEEPTRIAREQVALERGLGRLSPPHKKNYTDMCPCGIHHSQCEYHK